MTVIAAQFDSDGVRMVADSRSTRLDGSIIRDDTKKLLRMPEILFGFGGCAASAQRTAAIMATCEHRTLGEPLIKRFIELAFPTIIGGLSKEFIDARTAGGKSLFIALMVTHTEVKTVLVFRDGTVNIQHHWQHGAYFVAKEHLKENYMRETDGAKDARKFVEYAIASGFPGIGGPIQELRI